MEYLKELLDTFKREKWVVIKDEVYRYAFLHLCSLENLNVHGGAFIFPGEDEANPEGGQGYYLE